MKNVIIGALSTIFMLMIVLFMFTVYGRHVRTREIDDGLNNAMRIATEMLMEDEDYAPQSNEEFFADFMQAFSMHINSESTITVDVMAIDYSIGLLKLRVTSTYQHLTGDIGTVSIEKTIILEQYENENATAFYVVTYYVNGAVYKEYEVEEGSMHIVPSSVMLGSDFVGWKVLEGTGAGTIYSPASLKTKEVKENVSYIAVFD